MSYLPLATKYRPKLFSDVVGQSTTVTGIQNALKTDSLPSAYLLTGTRGVGKTTLARLIALAVNCLNIQNGEPCGSCTLCVSGLAGNNPDIYEIDGASKTKVEDMRALLENTLYLPLISRKKVYIIDEVHMLSQHSFNALLKTLEEPAAHVLFILATTEIEKIPNTIRSRCRHCALLPCSEQAILDRCINILAQEQIPYDASLHMIVHSAQGSIRDALTLLDQAITLGEGRVQERSVHALIRAVPEHQWSEWTTALFEDSDTEKLNVVLDAIEALDPNPKPFLDQLLSLMFKRSLEDFKRFNPLYDIVLQALQHLPHAPKPKVHIQMTWLKLWHALRHPPGRLEITIKHAKTGTQPAKEPAQASAPSEPLYTQILAPPLPTGLLGAALKQLHPHPEHPEDDQGYMTFVYPETQASLFTASTLKKIQQWIKDRAPEAKFHILAYAMESSTGQSSSAPTQSGVALSDEERSCLTQLGYPASSD